MRDQAALGMPRSRTGRRVKRGSRLNIVRHRRFEREAIALQHIMPEVHLSWADVSRYFFSAVFLDLGAALQQRCMRQHFKAILTYRFMQFTGSYRGNHFHRRMSREHKESYFYPR